MARTRLRFGCVQSYTDSLAGHAKSITNEQIRQLRTNSDIYFGRFRTSPDIQADCQEYSDWYAIEDLLRNVDCPCVE